MITTKSESPIKDALFGLAVGDALGVPVEFRSRASIATNPVTDMIGYGTYNLPPGTWSDDSSLAFCLAEALTEEFNLHGIALNFRNWLYKNYWTPRGEVFDVGIATQEAIGKLARGVDPELAGGVDERSNGNGSLMRILPLLFYIKDKDIHERYKITKAVSSITHAHVRSVISCFCYLEFARNLLEDRNPDNAYKKMCDDVTAHMEVLAINKRETDPFERLLSGNIHELPESSIFSSGYVLHTLEASFWCLLTTQSYSEAVLKAVNLGEDTDTTGAVTGGVAGLLYGYDSIPSNWIEQLARKNDIADLAQRMNAHLK